MSRRRKDDQPDETSERESSPEGEDGERRRRRRPTLGNPDADPARIHREYVERHVGGGGPATPEAYEQALRQWHELPGAVSTPPAEVRGEPTPPPEGSGEEQEDEGRDAEPPT
jgi:hypothetical protein